MLALYNTQTGRKEEFRPLEPGVVRMYTCGPTVYRFIHIGNLRSFLLADWVRRVLEQQGYHVSHVKNITDVGHMRQEMVERGEDKVIAAALAEGKTPWEIAQFYTEAFFRDEARLNILPALVFPRATEHVGEMIALVERLIGKGYAYEREGNVYFAVGKFPRYGSLSGNQLQGLMEGVRVEGDPLKRDQRDFTLWKATEPGRAMKWPSPWGEGFPGWHIECSAMSTKYLGEQLDIHTGGVDNIFPHHEGEIAQSEAASDKPFVRHWVHGQHLLADGLKMAKSTGNSYTLADVEGLGFEPLALRYLYLTAHYRRRMNFTFTSLRSAQRALRRLWDRLRGWADSQDTAQDEAGAAPWRDRFWDAVNQDLALPRALAVVWQMACSDLPPRSKLDLILEFDRIFGLDLARVAEEPQAVPQEVQVLAERRAGLRQRGEFSQADALRREIAQKGFALRDTPQGSQLFPLPEPDRLVGAVSSSKEVLSQLDQPDTADFSINILTHNYLADVQRCIASILRWVGQHRVEVLAVDSGSTDGTAEWLAEQAKADPRVRFIRADHNLGEGAGRNIGIKQSRGRHILLLDTSVEFLGDALTPLARTLEDGTVGVTGAWGARTHDLHHFEEGPELDVDAIMGYCFAFLRSRVHQAGLMDEKFRFYRNLDLDYSFRFKEKGLRIRATPDLPLDKHEHRAWSELGEEERDKLSRRNYYRFLVHWDGRSDLLVSPPSSEH